jgi:hypothetical protein
VIVSQARSDRWFNGGGGGSRVQPRLRGKAGELWTMGARVLERSRGGHGAAKLVLGPALLQNGEGNARGRR